MIKTPSVFLLSNITYVPAAFPRCYTIIIQVMVPFVTLIVTTEFPRCLNAGPPEVFNIFNPIWIIGIETETKCHKANN